MNLDNIVILKKKNDGKFDNNKFIEFNHNNIDNDEILSLSLITLYTSVYAFYIKSDIKYDNFVSYLANFYLEIDGYLKGPLNITHDENNRMLIIYKGRLPQDIFKVREFNVNTKLYAYLIKDDEYNTVEDDLIESVINGSEYIMNSERIKPKIIINGAYKDITNVLNYFEKLTDEKEIKKYLIKKNFK
ncbi:hypothetical protein UFVDC4_00032 [Staphylococcus phage vB_SauM-UFV_DC4]|nr:hypothetical protein UFVDC4_00032 [Staphylococcus phage vB_SauM-UFV_DC4]